ncbi:hypothetical protein Psch_00941 [Pelotomaculum schinkii]|uniref:Uncharacterized protein n=1 Tax=Pelotomaculum schinkii TaxID=78350 RepID=A0A4Y7RF61_9FIRM|nr:hypothetical protein [Pelotomaculum schinkii]TEB07390.1 hypothetical protein Psch_00941 [Pelotomaculum schinkii]
MRDKNLQAERIIVLNGQKDLDNISNLNLDLHLLESRTNNKSNLLETMQVTKPETRSPIKTHPTASVKVNSIIAKAKVKHVRR